jgi:hypothetical protein
MRLGSASKVAIASLATFGFAALFLAKADAGAVMQRIAGADRTLLAYAALIACLTALLRGARLGLAVADRIDIRLLQISVIHNAMTALLPMKLGEFALPLLLARAGRMRATEGIGLLLLLRMFDLFALVLVGALAVHLAFRSREPGIAHVAAGLFALLCLAAWAAWIAAARVGRVSSQVQRWVRFAWLGRLLTPLLTLDRRRLTVLAASSVCIWLSLFASFYCAARSIDPASAVVDVAVTGVASSLAFALPIAGVANIGPFQLAWVWMSERLGVAAGLALTASLVAHGTALAVICVLGIAAITALLLADRRARGARLAPPDR